MNKGELAGCVAWGMVGAAFCGGSLVIGLGSLKDPGPGLFPFLMALCLTFCSVAHFFSVVGKRSPVAPSVVEAGMPGGKREGHLRVLLIVFALFAYVLALNFLGFIVTTLIFMIFTLRFIEPQKWTAVFVVSILTTGMSYVIFEVWLETNLPMGFWGY